jgi:hypothetical protein
MYKFRSPVVLAILTSTRGLAVILLSLVYGALTRSTEPTFRRLSRRRRETLVAGGCG